MRRPLFIAALVAACIVGGVDRSVAAPTKPAVIETGKFDQAIADAKNAMMANPEAARAKASDAEQLAVRIANPKTRGVATATAKWLQGESYLRTNDMVRADAPIAEALASIAHLTPGSKIHADILLSKGGIESGKGHVGAALRSYQAAFQIYRTLNETRGQAMALLFIALLYTEALDQPTALRYYNQALELHKLDKNLAVSIYNNRGVAFKELGEFKYAGQQFDAALKLANELDSPLLKAKIYNNLARIKLAVGDVAAADREIRLGLGLATGEEVEGPRGELIATAAQSALQHGNAIEAAKLVARAFVNVDPAKTDLSFRDSHQTAYDAFTAVGDTRSALVHLRALKRLDDNATKLATNTSTALMAARFDFANQELRISQLKAVELRRSVAFERARVQTQRYVFLGAAAAVAIIIGMLTFALVTLRRSRDQVRAANDDLAVTNSALGKALAAKTEFLATTSHEIRTPLNGILGMTQVMLADPKLATDLRERLGVVHGAGVTMRALVDDILDVAKMETGNLTIESAPFDLRASVSDATRMWEEQARAKGLTFEVDLGDCPAMIIGDAARMRQIVFNLLSNALKFTKAGRVALSVRATGDTLRVVVSDSGIGIPAEKLEEIFESFRQADAGTTRQFGGTGLGLSICRNLARAMGGEVTVSSIMGEGAVFTLELPLVRAAAVVKEDAATASGAAMLIVDRNPITRSMFKTLLAPHSETILVAVSADEAIARLRDGGIANVLIDDATVRAGDDALATLAEIVAAAGDAATTLLWPAVSAVSRDELLATGLTRVVSKPVAGAALIAELYPRSVSKNHAIPDLVSQAA